MRTPCRDDLAAAFGRHARAKTVPALAHQFARLIGPFQGIFSAARQTGVRKRPLIDQARLLHAVRSPVSARQRAIGAAYTKALPARQCDVLTIFPQLAGRARCIMCDSIETNGPKKPTPISASCARVTILR